MVVIAHADITGCMLARLRSFPELTALVGGASPRISASFQESWAMPVKAVLLRKAGGPIIGDDYALGLKRTRIDVFCYGATGLDADRLWAMVDAILVPRQGEHPASFHQAGCRVDTIVPEADADAQVEPDTGLHRVFSPYLVNWWSLP